ncbi:hypothetical protein EBZ39_19305 [bacterium]|nr:hypothetical protein [bacterium]
MPKFLIKWEARGIFGSEVIKAENLEDAMNAAYAAAKDDFEMSIDYEAMIVAEAVREGEISEEEAND